MGTGKKQTDQMIEVDARKLAQGLKAAFAGMAMVFDSIGVETDIEAEEKAGGKTARRSSTAKPGKKPAGDITQGEEPVSDAQQVPAIEDGNAHSDDDEDASGITGDPGSDTAAGSTADPAAAPTTDNAPGEGSAPDNNVPEAPGITLDDVTKIIVQKIKKNRSNNEKIGHILKAYGVAKVGELDASKYEAFLTDLSEL